MTPRPRGSRPAAGQDLPLAPAGVPDAWGRVVLLRPARTERTTTIGREKAATPLLAAGDEDAFVKALLASLGTFPAIPAHRFRSRYTTLRDGDYGA